MPASTSIAGESVASGCIHCDSAWMRRLVGALLPGKSGSVVDKSVAPLHLAPFWRLRNRILVTRMVLARSRPCKTPHSAFATLKPGFFCAKENAVGCAGQAPRRWTRTSRRQQKTVGLANAPTAVAAKLRQANSYRAHCAQERWRWELQRSAWGR